VRALWGWQLEWEDPGLCTVQPALLSVLPTALLALQCDSVPRVSASSKGS